MAVVEKIELRKFVAPEFIFGGQARLLAGRYAKNLGARKALVVTDPGVIDAGWTAQVLSSLEEEGLPYSVFSSVSSNPRAEEVMLGAKFYRSEDCNIIVATGGGSPMDCAKGIGIVDSNDMHILEFEGVDRVPVPGPPLICIPTTAGSSADVSQFAIINDADRQVKIAIVSKTVVPDAALIDPVTTTTMDAHLTACTGMDALTHAIEAYVSDASSPITDLHALEAIRLVSSSLLDLLSDTGNILLRSKMMLGSLHAGLAFSNASLGAVHAMAHSLGGLLDLPHGHCNAILLPRVMDFNYDTVPERYRSIGEAMGLHLEGMVPDQQRKAVLGKIEHLQRSAGVCQPLGQMGTPRRDIPRLAENAMQDACMVTNPRKPNRKDIEEIYEKAF
ncbi:MAG TPA: iron-containing alcohol dehydrogenase [Syntrophorhabdaceae bacterium]|nr:iron-containing alcohol dehydrogenase [Syntrophorhabdaceae bacterium]